MSMTYFRTDDAVVTISNAAYNALAAEQRMDCAISVHTAITIAAAIGLVVTFGALVVTKILGA
jgi:hypothetical protein